MQGVEKRKLFNGLLPVRKRPIPSCRSNLGTSHHALPKCNLAFFFPSRLIFNGAIYVRCLLTSSAGHLSKIPRRSLLLQPPTRKFSIHLFFFQKSTYGHSSTRPKREKGKKRVTNMCQGEEKVFLIQGAFEEYRSVRTESIPLCYFCFGERNSFSQFERPSRCPKLSKICMHKWEREGERERRVHRLFSPFFGCGEGLCVPMPIRPPKHNEVSRADAQTENTFWWRTQKKQLHKNETDDLLLVSQPIEK